MDRKINDRFIEGMKISMKAHPKICDTQKKFCKIMDMHQPKIAQIKNYEVAPTVEQIEKIGRMFDISPTWIILGVEPKIITFTKK